MTPASRHFIGPLTRAQQRRRERSRETFRLASEISDVRNIPMREALGLATSNRWYPGRAIQMARP